ncbi:MAG: DUF6080 domain-containing protein [Prevotella sp.]|nr:DUF6080 domain-containing protein [Prevotellaceae bacterium]MDY3936226.1 DUF6080 domain-containing protein [Prevotella sp.]MDY4218089.1 DUF6080 domain-containing protein [Prevotella sp.]
MSAFSIFKVKREERWLAMCLLLVFATFTTLLILSHFDVYTMGARNGFWSIFTKNFRVSGYDNWSWITLSGMRIHFETNRHPLFLSFLYPMFLLNRWLIEQTGTNCAVFFMASLTLFSAFYSVIFMFRIFREVIELKRYDATLLTLLMFSFAHVMLPTFVPDHFVISLMLLLLTIYLCGMKMKQKQLLSPYQTGLLLFFTAGMATSNGLKTLFAGLFANGRYCFNPKYIFFGFIVPIALLIGIQQWQYYAFEVPQKAVIARIEANVKKKNAQKTAAYKEERNQWLATHTGKNFDDSKIGKLMDVSTPRGETLIENFFGESIQLHQDYLLKDVSWDRPIFVKYSWWINYAIEAFIVLLFIFGGFIAFKESLFRMLLLWFSVDVGLHLVLGFAINEVYIMSAGWIFIIPIAIAYFLKLLSFSPQRVLRVVLSLLTLWLWAYNGSQIVTYFL